jgi:hypothetical protein
VGSDEVLWPREDVAEFSGQSARVNRTSARFPGLIKISWRCFKPGYFIAPRIWFPATRSWLLKNFDKYVDKLVPANVLAIRRNCTPLSDNEPNETFACNSLTKWWWHGLNCRYATNYYDNHANYAQSEWYSFPFGSLELSKLDFWIISIGGRMLQLSYRICKGSVQMCLNDCASNAPRIEQNMQRCTNQDASGRISALPLWRGGWLTYFRWYL